MNAEVLMTYSGILKISGKRYHAEWDEVEEQRLINQGAHGTVSLCKFRGHLMAVKSIQLDREADLQVAGNDLRTISLSHPNIVKYYGLFVTEGCLKICMEYMAGCFDQFLKITDQPIPENIIGKMSVSVVTALHFLRTRNIMHRDIKPSNILMSWSGVVKLCDFGISRELVLSRAHTREAGCVLYMAPERFEADRQEGYGIRSDVWSFGITLVELATGKYPYAGNEYNIMRAIQKEDSPRLDAESFSPDFCDLVERCLQKDPERRPTFHELLNHPFIQYHGLNTDAEDWIADILSEE